jgi:hypothetical protein
MVPASSREQSPPPPLPQPSSRPPAVLASSATHAKPETAPIESHSQKRPGPETFVRQSPAPLARASMFADPAAFPAARKLRWNMEARASGAGDWRTKVSGPGRFWLLCAPVSSTAGSGFHVPAELSGSRESSGICDGDSDGESAGYRATRKPSCDIFKVELEPCSIGKAFAVKTAYSYLWRLADAESTAEDEGLGLFSYRAWFEFHFENITGRRLVHERNWIPTGSLPLHAPVQLFA